MEDNFRQWNWAQKHLVFGPWLYEYYKIQPAKKWTYLPSKESAIVEGTPISCYSNRHSLTWTLINIKTKKTKNWNGIKKVWEFIKVKIVKCDDFP